VCAGRAASASPSCTTANSDGNATLFGSAGTYFVRIGGPAEQRWQETTRVVDLSSGPAALWVALQPLHRISGTVRDETGVKVAGAQACAHPAIDEQTVCVRSVADGTYALDVKAGIYRLEVSGPAGARLVSQWARGRAFLEEADVLDARVADVPDVDVDLIRGVALRGVVTFGGTVVEDAQVCLRTLAAPLPLECERTDKQGRYTGPPRAGSVLHVDGPSGEHPRDPAVVGRRRHRRGIERHRPDARSHRGCRAPWRHDHSRHRSRERRRDHRQRAGLLRYSFPDRPDLPRDRWRRPVRDHDAPRDIRGERDPAGAHGSHRRVLAARAHLAGGRCVPRRRE
jgi:hypothetical protein